MDLLSNLLMFLKQYCMLNPFPINMTQLGHIL